MAYGSTPPMKKAPMKKALARPDTRSGKTTPNA